MANFDKPYTAKNDKIVASENQPWTVAAWRYNPDTDATAVEPVSHDVATTNVVTTKKDKTVASENQPWTVSAWRYNPETGANVVEPVSHDVATTNAFTTKKDKTAASENQPWTVSAWRYNSETDANAVEPVSHDVATTKKDKIVASENQPWTVSAWRYNPETDANVVELVSLEVATTNPVTTKKDKTVASENQPWTVSAWRYNPETDANAVEPVSHDVATTNVVTIKKDKTIAIENQPWTVSAWRYNPETNANAVEPVSHDVATTNAVTIKKDKIVASENQPWTVSAWRYNPETDANAVEPVSHDVATTNVVTTKKDKTFASENQPWTVSAWRYNPDTNANAVEPVSDAVTTKKDKTVASENQPWTVAAWRYNPDNINEKNSIKASHNHHHFIHNANSKDSEVKEENLNGGSVFFVEESLRLGMKLKHDFQKTKKRPYLPKKIAQSIPFSVDKVAEILNLFSIKSKSAEATAIKETLGICLQRPKVKKENRTCAQSMEDIVDFVVKELGTNDVQLRMMRNNIEVAHGIQDYVVTKVKKLVVPGNTAAACHRMVYPYVVYYCHHQQDIGHYDITLVSPTSGNAIQTTAVCHYDTYAWQPDVEALRYLGIRPGDAPVCHFSAIHDMFWSIKPTRSKYLDMAQ